jgi:hypothetical protein
MVQSIFLELNAFNARRTSLSISLTSLKWNRLNQSFGEGGGLITVFHVGHFGPSSKALS